MNKICETCDTKNRLRLCSGRDGDFKYCFRKAGSTYGLEQTITPFNTTDELEEMVSSARSEGWHEGFEAGFEDGLKLGLAKTQVHAWHSLKQHPDDLPPYFRRVEIATVNKDDGMPGYNYFTRYGMRHPIVLDKTLDMWLPPFQHFDEHYEIVGWRYPESFKEEVE